MQQEGEHHQRPGGVLRNLPKETAEGTTTPAKAAGSIYISCNSRPRGRVHLKTCSGRRGTTTSTTGRAACSSTRTAARGTPPPTRWSSNNFVKESGISSSTKGTSTTFQQAPPQFRGAPRDSPSGEIRIGIYYPIV